MNRRSFIKLGGSTTLSTKISSITKGRILTIKMWANPQKYINPKATKNIDDIDKWTEEKFTYEKDPFLGIYDSTKPVNRFIKEKSGDCDDYSLFALSWLIQRDKEAYLVFGLTKEYTLHIFVHDGLRVYDYGGIQTHSGSMHDMIWKREKKVSDGETKMAQGSGI
jgi:hypothetical protein